MSDAPASSSHAVKCMEAAQQIYDEWCERAYPPRFAKKEIEEITAIIIEHVPPSVPVSVLEELAATWEAWSPRNPTEFEAGIEQGRYADAVELRRVIKATREPKP